MSDLKTSGRPLTFDNAGAGHWDRDILGPRPIEDAKDEQIDWSVIND